MPKSRLFSPFLSVRKKKKRTLDLENEIGRGTLYGPTELVDQGLVENLLDRNAVLLAPSNGDAGVQVVDLGGAEGGRLVLILVHLFDLELVNALIDSGNLLEDLLHREARR